MQRTKPGSAAVERSWGRLLPIGFVAVLGVGAPMVAGAYPAQAAAGVEVAVTDGRMAASPGNLLRYTITVVNSGDEPATQLSARQVLDESVIFVSASGGGRWDAAGRSVSWPRFSLDPGSTRQLTVEARIRPDPPMEPASASVSVTGSGVAAEATDETVVSPGLDVRITDGRESARPSDVLTYTITVDDPEPAGPVPVSVVDTLAPGLEFVSAPGATFDPATRRVSWRAFARRPGRLSTLTVTARLAPDSPAGVVSNSVVVGTRSSAYRAVDDTTVRTAAATSADVVPAGTMTFLDQNQGGSWCWFEDERVLIDRAGRRLYAGVNTGVDMYGAGRLLELDLGSGARRILDQGRAEVDDHDTAAIWEAPNGEILTSWARHGKDQLHRQFRRATDGSWSAQAPVPNPWFVTYNNLYSVDGGRLLYNFSRSAGNDPHVATSTDNGRTWTQRGRLLRDPEDRVDRWPYLKYTSNGSDRIDFMATPSHPRQTATEIYHGFIRNGTVYRSDGTPLGPIGSSIDVERLTLVWAPPTETQDGWDVDLALDPATGTPVLMFTRNIDFGDNRFYYARWNGSVWSVAEVGYAGRSLYDPERHYTGLAAIDPDDVDNVVIATDADPVSGTPLISAADGRRHRELYRGLRGPDGRFTWTAMTSSSTVDNLRPVWTTSPSGATALMWLRGRYTTFLDFSMSLVGIVRRADGSIVAPGSVATPAAAPPAQLVPGNFDTAATSDLLMYRSGPGAEELRLFDNRRNISPVPVPAAEDERRPVAGDFTGDKQTDIYWYAPGPASETLWRQYGSAFLASTPMQVGGTYVPVVGDFDGDHDDDIFWYAPGSAAESMWLSSNGTFRSVPTSQVGGTYTPFVGDFDGSGTDDIFWYAAGPAGDSIWFGSNGAFPLNVPVQVNASYQPIVGNYDARYGDDIFWYNQAGADPLWLSTGSRNFSDVRSRDMGPPPAGGHTAVSGDFDGTGGDDLIWFAPTGVDLIWESRLSPFDTVRQITL